MEALPPFSHKRIKSLTVYRAGGNYNTLRLNGLCKRRLETGFVGMLSSGYSTICGVGAPQIPISPTLPTAIDKQNLLKLGKAALNP
jgi:hypothetical protein